MPCILAVDDSVTMRQMIAATLQSAGYEVLQASCGLEALQVVKSRRVDLILTDINMPNLDGLSLIRLLREMPNYRFTPILALTTESAQEIKQKGRQVGATGWIVKPFNPAQLLDVLKRVIG